MTLIHVSSVRTKGPLQCAQLVIVESFFIFIALQVSSLSFIRDVKGFFPLKPLFPSCVIYILCEKGLIKEDTTDPGYINLFLHDFRHRDKVNSLLPYDKYKRIPHGVVEHEDNVPVIPKLDYPKPVNALLKSYFDENLPVTPVVIKRVETYVKSLRPSNSDSLMIKDKGKSIFIIWIASNARGINF